MAGTIEGGKKAAAANKLRDPDHYRKIGAIGGSKGHTGGFAHDSRTWWEKLLRKPKLAKIAGRKGGSMSKRTKKVVNAL